MAGRPKGSTNDRAWRDALRKAAFEYAEGNKGPKKIEIAARMMVDKLVAGDGTIMREFGDRLDGKVPQAVTGADGGPVIVEITRFAKD